MTVRRNNFGGWGRRWWLAAAVPGSSSTPNIEGTEVTLATDTNYTAHGLTLLQSTLNFLIDENEAKACSLDAWKAPGT